MTPYSHSSAQWLPSSEIGVAWTPFRLFHLRWCCAVSDMPLEVSIEVASELSQLSVNTQLSVHDHSTEQKCILIAVLLSPAGNGTLVLGPEKDRWEISRDNYCRFIWPPIDAQQRDLSIAARLRRALAFCRSLKISETPCRSDFKES